MAFGEILISVPPREVIPPSIEIRRDRLSGGSNRLVIIEHTDNPDSLVTRGIGGIALIRDGVSMTGDYHRVFAARADTLPDAYDEVSDEPDTTATIILGYN